LTKHIKMKKLVLFHILALLLLSACSPKYILRVNPETKTKFGFEVTAPNIAVFFVENVNSPIGVSNIDRHKKIADSLYEEYGPARDNFFIARTDAKDFKFSLKKKTYYIEVQNLPQRTAMIIFNGRCKPAVYFEPEKYSKIIKDSQIINIE
jgi:hypothetical protein